MTPDSLPLVLGLLSDHQVDPFPTGADGIEYRSVRNVETLPSLLVDTAAIVLWDYGKEVIERAWTSDLPLEWIHVAGAGVSEVLFPRLVDSDVVVTNSRGVFDESVSEYALALLHALVVDLHGSFRFQDERRWVHRKTSRLSGSTMLVVGPGSIGRAVCRRAQNLGMDVVAVGRTEKDADPDFRRVYAVDDLASIISGVDHVVITAPLTDQTVGLFGEDILSRLTGATIVNVGRGAIVDEAALINALRRGEVAGAALDVFSDEPLSSASPLWAEPGLIISPHMAGDSPGIEEALQQLWLSNLRHWLEGDPLINVIDKHHGY